MAKKSKPSNGEQLTLELTPNNTEPSPPATPTHTCDMCEHLHCVRFSRRRIFFCSLHKGKGGNRYGLKRKKSEPACYSFKKATEPIAHRDGYYGTELEPIARPKPRKEE